MKKIICIATIIVLVIMSFIFCRYSIDAAKSYAEREDSLPSAYHLSELSQMADNTSNKGGLPYKEEGINFNKLPVSGLNSTGVVVVDAGHGGNDNGCEFDGVYEKDINLKVALMVKDKLEAMGLTVILTREADDYISLEERANTANSLNADYFISIHCNSFEDDSMSGFEGYYWHSKKAEELNEYIFSAVSEKSINVRNIKEEEYFVLRETRMTAVLLEIGYLSNEQERNMLQREEYQEIISTSIADGIARVFNS